MSTNLGQLEAQRILRARQSDAERTAQQGREERILCTEQPRFFSTMADHLVEIVNSFNKEMGLEGEDAVTFTHSGSEMYLGKKASPFFLRRLCILSELTKSSFAPKSSMATKRALRGKVVF